MVQAGGMRCGGEKVRQKMSGGKAERSGRNDDGQEKACDKAGRNACCRIKAKGADRGNEICSNKSNKIRKGYFICKGWFWKCKL